MKQQNNRNNNIMTNISYSIICLLSIIIISFVCFSGCSQPTTKHTTKANSSSAAKIKKKHYGRIKNVSTTSKKSTINKKKVSAEDVERIKRLTNQLNQEFLSHKSNINANTKDFYKSSSKYISTMNRFAKKFAKLKQEVDAFSKNFNS